MVGGRELAVGRDLGVGEENGGGGVGSGEGKQGGRDGEQAEEVWGARREESAVQEPQSGVQFETMVLWGALGSEFSIRPVSRWMRYELRLCGNESALFILDASALRVFRCCVNPSPHSDFPGYNAQLV